MEFDKNKWDEILRQWDGEYADQLESDKDAMDLADPKTWADQDAKAQLNKAFASTGVAPSDGPDAEPDADPDDPSPAAQSEPSFRLQPSPATAGAGQQGEPPVDAKPAALPSPESLDWKGLASRLDRAERGRSLARASESMFANIGAQSGYKPNAHAGEADVELAKQPLELAKAKQDLDRGALTNKSAATGLQAKAAMDDPNSLQSQKAREALQSMGVPLPRGIDNFSANDIHNFVKTGELVRIQADQAAEKDRMAKSAASDAQKAGALADRKRTMLSLYPDNANEINALNDLGDAQTLQTALEGRAGRSATQAHSDQAATVADRRALEREIALRKYEAEHPKPQPMTAEQHTQLEALNKSEGVINEFEKALGKVRTPAQKAAAAFPKVGGAAGAEGSEFPSARTMAATQLARGLEGGTAKPGNVEMIDQILPTHLDADGVRATKLKQLRDQMKANRAGFMKAMEQSGQRPPASGGKVRVSNGKETLLIDPGDVDAAAADGYTRASQ